MDYIKTNPQTGNTINVNDGFQCEIPKGAAGVYTVDVTNVNNLNFWYLASNLDQSVVYTGAGAGDVAAEVRHTYALAVEGGKAEADASGARAWAAREIKPGESSRARFILAWHQPYLRATKSRRSNSSRIRGPPRTWQAVPWQTVQTCLPRGVRLKAR